MSSYFFWAADDSGPGYYRTQQPARVLRMLGHDVTECQWVIPSLSETADVIVGARVCQPGPSKQWLAWAEQGRHLVWDVDDDLFSVHKDSDAYAFFKQPQIQAGIKTNAAAATRITTCSDRLADVMSAYNDDVRVVRNGLPAEVLTWTRAPNPQPVIGWAGTRQSLPEIALAARALTRVLERPPKPVTAHTIGVSGADLAGHGFRHPRARVTSWVAGTDAYLAAIDFDIWLAPYRRTPFNVAKFPTKALEAAFLGIPLIASDIPPYRAFIRHGETGFLAAYDRDWERYLRLLIEDDDLRNRMGEAARVQATAHVVEGIAPDWIAALAP